MYFKSGTTMLFIVGLYRIFEFVFNSNPFEAILVIRNIEITVKMADTSSYNEKSLSVSTTATTSDTGLEMYPYNNRIGNRERDQIGPNGHKRSVNQLVCMANMCTSYEKPFCSNRKPLYTIP